MSMLNNLRRFTTVVADTGDISAIRQFLPEDATTNPSLILNAASLPLYLPLIKEAVSWALEQGGSKETILLNEPPRFFWRVFSPEAQAARSLFVLVA